MSVPSLKEVLSQGWPLYLELRDSGKAMYRIRLLDCSPEIVNEKKVTFTVPPLTIDTSFELTSVWIVAEVTPGEFKFVERVNANAASTTLCAGNTFTLCAFYLTSI